MPANYVLLEKITVGASGASSVTFSNIPQTGYTDLLIKGSARSLRASDEDGMAFGINGTGATNWVLLSGNGSSASSGTLSSTGFGAAFIGRIPAANVTANTFGNFELYLPNYTSSNAKSYSVDAATENNSSTAYLSILAATQSSTAAVTSVILLASNANLAAGSTFYLYGVAKLGTTPAIQAYATGGDTIMTDGTYWYHAFRSSGTFTPAKGLSCDVLVVAGGGGGGGNITGGAYYVGAGGGAGGVLAYTSQPVATAQTVTIGAGGSAGISSTPGTNGGNSQFGSLTAALGGGWGASASNGGVSGTSKGATGGSGGGSMGQSGGQTGGLGTAGQGNNGGAGTYSGGGGGGAGGVGGNSNFPTTNQDAGVGGAGTNTYSTWLNVTGTGVSGFIAGGGGGGMSVAYGDPANYANGGSGGGGRGGAASAGNSRAQATGAGVANTGGGGGGGGANGNAGGETQGAAGGSGLVIVRYPV